MKPQTKKPSKLWPIYNELAKKGYGLVAVKLSWKGK